MFAQKSVFAVTKFVKRFVRDLLELNWNDHILAEIGASKQAHDRGVQDNEM